ncbi:hypothetical protein [Stenotrophomonas pavanii]|uniref:hypothetical protein n=1 Tax=Stenotrophomonas pavanii TaxID=487698 RepID=UPI0039C6FD6A
MNWQEALSAYDAHLADDGRIVRKGKTLGVVITEKRNRLRIESVAGTMLASGPVEPRTVERFVESYWYWTKECH